MIMRHNNLRDVNAEFQKEVCHDVKVEPMLIPIEGENTQIEGAKEDGAHPDISSRGLWSPFERTFYDVRSVLVALRGQRGKPTTSAKPLAVTSFDLIPQSMAYESY